MRVESSETASSRIYSRQQRSADTTDMSALHTDDSKQKEGPAIPPLPEQFKHFRSDFGHSLYGPDGYNISRHDHDAANKARLRNYEFFGAPTIGVISMNQDLALVDAMSVGMYVQLLMLLLNERGYGTCLQVSVTGYPDVLRRGFELEDDQVLLCGICIGVPAKDARVNNMTVSRDALDKQVTFMNG